MNVKSGGYVADVLLKSDFAATRFHLSLQEGVFELLAANKGADKFEAVEIVLRE